MALPSKQKLESYLDAKLHTKRVPGYFKDGGEFVRGPCYNAMLGKQIVGVAGSPGYQDGYYITREDAINGAKLFVEKTKEALANGNFS